MKGDRISVMVDKGDGNTQTFELVASKIGRRLEIINSRGIIEIDEVTRNGITVRTARFMASRVIAIVESPTETSDA